MEFVGEFARRYNSEWLPLEGELADARYERMTEEVCGTIYGNVSFSANSFDFRSMLFENCTTPHPPLSRSPFPSRGRHALFYTSIQTPIYDANKNFYAK